MAINHINWMNDPDTHSYTYKDPTFKPYTNKALLTSDEQSVEYRRQVCDSGWQRCCQRASIARIRINLLSTDSPTAALPVFRIFRLRKIRRV